MEAVFMKIFKFNLLIAVMLIIEAGAATLEQGGKGACKDRLEQALEGGMLRLNLGGVADANQAAIATVAQFLATLAQNKAFGTESNNLLIDLSRTDITARVAVEICRQASGGGKRVILNLSRNQHITNAYISEILQSNETLQCLAKLNLQGTNVGDEVVSPIVQLIGSGRMPNLREVNFKGTSVTQSGAAQVAASIAAARTRTATVPVAGAPSGNPEVLKAEPGNGAIQEISVADVLGHVVAANPTDTSPTATVQAGTSAATPPPNIDTLVGVLSLEAETALPGASVSAGDASTLEEGVDAVAAAIARAEPQ